MLYPFICCLEQLSGQEKCYTEFLEHSDFYPHPQSCELGCIDVHSGALDVSKLGTYLSNPLFFFFIQKNFWCFCLLRDRYLILFLFLIALRNAWFGPVVLCPLFSSPKVFYFLYQRKRAGLLGLQVTYIHSRSAVSVSRKGRRESSFLSGRRQHI